MGKSDGNVEQSQRISDVVEPVKPRSVSTNVKPLTLQKNVKSLPAVNLTELAANPANKPKLDSKHKPLAKKAQPSQYFLNSSFLQSKCRNTA